VRSGRTPYRCVARAAAVLLLASAAISPQDGRAEQVQSGDLVLTVQGSLAPQRLPRRRPVPAVAGISAQLKTTDDKPVPRVRQIEVAFGAAAVLSGVGLPACPRARLRNASTSDALHRCGGALVGRGHLPLEIHLPGQLPLHRDPRLLVFNGRGSDGGRVLWVHAFTAQPPVSFVLSFHVHRVAGSPGTSLTATVPRTIARWARIRGFAIRLGSSYRRLDRPHGFLLASCPVPRPFTGGFFPVARTTFGFAGGRHLGESIVGNCKVAR